LIILNSLSNPTRGIIPLDDLEHIADAAVRRDCRTLADEIYARMVYEALQAPSILGVDEDGRNMAGRKYYGPQAGHDGILSASKYFGRTPDAL